jgi:hypothetical protein
VRDTVNGYDDGVFVHRSPRNLVTDVGWNRVPGIACIP